MIETDIRWMRRAIQLAESGRGFVEPNPLVGAVVLQDDRVVGEGFHPRFGGPHAEVVALDQAGADAAGATLYVTLEPCCHHGKTPPCTDRVLASKVRRVVVAMLDPFPLVSGQGVQILKQAGLEVDVGCLEAQSRELNAPYLTLLKRGRPYVHAKWAMTLDGKIATVAGQSQWISNEASRRHAHAFRGLLDAIIVGVGTALADDPELTARPSGPRVATRVVLDSTGRLPLQSKLVQSARETPTLVVTTERADPAARQGVVDAGCECLCLPANDNGRIPLEPLLQDFGRRRWTNVLVEGGSAVLGSFLSASLIDAVRVYVAPRIVGGQAAKGPVGGEGIASLAESLSLDGLEATTLDGDLFLSGKTIFDSSRCS